MFRTQQRTIHEPLTTVKDATHKEAGSWTLCTLCTGRSDATRKQSVG